MANMTTSKVHVNKEHFLYVLKLKNSSIRKLGKAYDQIERTEKTIRRCLDDGEMTPDLLDKIAKYLGVPSDYLAGIYNEEGENANNYESENKLVSHPPHYQSKNGLEVIDVVEAFTSELSGIEAADTGNIIKYICRWKKKNGIEDLEKIMWYTQHLINHLKKESK